MATHPAGNRPMQELITEAPAWLKALAAAFAGRALLLLEARRDVPITMRRVATAIFYETPLIVAFALLGWHTAALFGLTDESTRIVLTVMLANLGARGIDRIVSRVFPPRQDPPA